MNFDLGSIMDGACGRPLGPMPWRSHHSLSGSDCLPGCLRGACQQHTLFRQAFDTSNSVKTPAGDIEDSIMAMVAADQQERLQELAEAASGPGAAGATQAMATAAR
jgi:hypothetical protein